MLEQWYSDCSIITQGLTVFSWPICTRIHLRELISQPSISSCDFPYNFLAWEASDVCQFIFLTLPFTISHCTKKNKKANFSSLLNLSRMHCLVFKNLWDINRGFNSSGSPLSTSYGHVAGDDVLFHRGNIPSHPPPSSLHLPSSFFY